MNCIQPSAPGGRDVEVGAERGLDPVDRGEHLPRDPVLGSAGLVDRQQERRDRELVDDEVRDADRRGAEVGDRHRRVRVGRSAVGVAVGLGVHRGAGATAGLVVVVVVAVAVMAAGLVDARAVDLAVAAPAGAARADRAVVVGGRRRLAAARRGRGLAARRGRGLAARGGGRRCSAWSSTAWSCRWSRIRWRRAGRCSRGRPCPGCRRRRRRRRWSTGAGPGPGRGCRRRECRSGPRPRRRRRRFPRRPCRQRSTRQERRG